MARRKKIKLEAIKCPRCGRKVMSMNRPISSQKAFDKYRGICEKCITPEEEHDMLELQGNAYLDM